MAEIKVLARTGRPTGSRASRRLRAAGQVPGTVYGQGTEPMSVAVDWKPFRAALTTEAGLNALLDLELDGDTRLAIVKDLQRHPVTGNVLHVDFLLISRDTEIAVDVPLVIAGEASHVTREGGLIEHLLNSLTIKAKPGNIPNELVVDVSELSVGDAVRVGDIALPPGVTTDVDPEEPVVITTLAPAPMAEAEEAEAAEEAAEAAGQAPAAEETGGEAAAGAGSEG